MGSEDITCDTCPFSYSHGNGKEAWCFGTGTCVKSDYTWHADIPPDDCPMLEALADIAKGEKE